MRGKRRHSLFARLLGTFVVTGLVLVSVFFGGVNRAFDVETHDVGSFKRLATHLLARVEADIGSPPVAAKVDALAEDLGIDVVVEHGGYQVASDTRSFPSIKEIIEESTGRRHRARWFAGNHAQQPLREAGIQMGSWQSKWFLAHEVGDTRYLFLQRQTAWSFRLHEEVLAITLALMILTLVGAWWSMKRMLRPLAGLHAGVERIGRGQLDMPVPERGPEELASLAQSFNEMASRIRAMLRDKEQLLLDVSHELRSPLARMKVALELEGPAARQALAEDLNEMERMTATLLEAARQAHPYENAPVAPASLTELTREVAAGYAGLPPGIEWDDGTEVAALMDREKARTAIRNILDNAVKYSRPDSKPIRLAVTADAESVTLSVTDDGVGLEESELARVLEPFYRVDRARTRAVGSEVGGFGLGLHLTDRLMRAQGGSVELARGARSGVVARLRFRR